MKADVAEVKAAMPNTDNLTGGQIQDILDTLILQAVSPIVRGSDSFDMQIGYVLSSTARNKKRKLSSLDRDEAIDKMCQFLVTQDRAEKVTLVSEMRLERGFIYNFVVNFLKEVEGYCDLYHELLVSTDAAEAAQIERKLLTLEESVGCSRSHLFHTMKSAGDYLRLAYKFRNIIVMQYVKHSFKQARSYVKMKGKNFDFRDVSQNFLTAVTKAVDKYDSSKGALTSYINWWLLNAQTTSNSAHGHEYGIAYTIPQLQKKALAEKSNKAKSVNFGISLDKMVGKNGEETPFSQYIAGDASVEEDLLASEELDNIRSLAKHADIRGVARLYLDIDEVFSNKERKRMLEVMRRQLGVVPARTSEGGVEFVPDPRRGKKKRKKEAKRTH